MRMADRKGTGILVVMADVPAELEEEFNRWYNEEHIEELDVAAGGAECGAVRGDQREPEAFCLL